METNRILYLVMEYASGGKYITVFVNITSLNVAEFLV